jgi:hypothetical protein
MSGISLPPISPRHALLATPRGLAHGQSIPTTMPWKTLAAAPNPMQSPRMHLPNGRSMAFTTSSSYVCSGAPIERARYADSGLGKSALVDRLQPIRSAREAIRVQRREEHARKCAEAKREQEEYKAIQRRHAHLMRAYHKHNNERFRAAQLVQLLQEARAQVSSKRHHRCTGGHAPGP